MINIKNVMSSNCEFIYKLLYFVNNVCVCVCVTGNEKKFYCVPGLFNN